MIKKSLSFLQIRVGKRFSAFILLAVLIGLGNINFPTPQKVNGQSASQSCPTCSPPTQQIIYAPTIGLPEATGSEIVLNCRSSQVMDVTPTFYTVDGQAIVGAMLNMQPSEMRFVTIESLIPAEHRGQHLWGGMSLSYTGRTLEMWAQVTLRGLNGIGSADVTFSILTGRGTDTQEAVWYMPNGNSTAILALGNSSNAPIQTRLQYSNGNIQDVSIAPFATRYIRRQNGNSVKLTTTGAVGSLKATGFVTNNSQNFTSGIRFYETQSVVQPNLFASNFKVKNHTSHLLLKNTSAASVTAQARFSPTTGTGNAIELPSVIINAGEIVELNLQPLVSANASRIDLNSVSVQITNNGAAGSLIGALYSTNRTTTITQDIPLRDSGRLRNSTGAYPWRLDDDYSSIVYINNVGSETAQFTAKIYYAGGSYMLATQQLAAGATASFDIKRLRDNRVPDRNGNIIPATATVGQFAWSMLHITDGTKLIGRSEVVSRSQKVSSSYSCPICCPNSGPSFDPQPILLFAGGSFSYYLDGFWVDCYGREAGVTAESLAVNVAEPNIATAIMGNGLFSADGVSVGETYWYANYYTWQYQDDGIDCYNISYFTNTGGEIGVRPVITSISPSRGGVGSITRVTINGSGFRFDNTVNAGSGISVSIFSISSTQIVADFTIASNATGGNRNVTVSGSGQTSNAVNFFVQIPTSLSVLLVTIIPTPTVADPLASSCSPGVDYGISVAIKYQVNDQSNPSSPIQNNIMVPQETVTNLVVNGVPRPDPFPTFDDLGPTNVTGTSRTTDANGQFLDAPFGACANGPFTASETQDIRMLIDNTQNSYHVRTNNFAFASTTSGQGSITNNSDIQKSRP